MMRRALPLAALAIAGCARLDVQVDVIEPRYAREAALDAGLRIEAADIATSPHGRTDYFVSEVYGAFLEYRDACVDELVQRISAIPVSQDLQRAAVEDAVQGLTQIKRPESESSTTITQEREAARLRLQVLDNVVFQSLRGRPTAGIGVRNPPPITPELRNSLLNRRAEIARIETDLRRHVRGELEAQFSCTVTADRHASGLSGAQRQEADRATQRKGAEAEQKIAQAARLTTITGDGRLLNNNLEAFYVTRAPERFWAPRYNRAFGRGVFGSSSIAIVMNETADFSVKGFVFDARSTAQMVQKVGTQAVSMIAAAHGAPILPRAPGTTTGGPTQFSTTDAISTNQMTVERAEAEQEAYEVAMVRVADSILSNWTSLTGASGTARTSASSVVSGTIRAYENSWRTTQPQPKQ